jgi:hypothetical protein
MARPRERRLRASEREFRALMLSVGCEDFACVADLLGVPERTVKGYASEGRPVPEPVKRLLRAFAVYGIDVRRIL